MDDNAAVNIIDIFRLNKLERLHGISKRARTTITLPIVHECATVRRGCIDNVTAHYDVMPGVAGVQSERLGRHTDPFHYLLFSEIRYMTFNANTVFLQDFKSAVVMDAHARFFHYFHCRFMDNLLSGQLCHIRSFLLDMRQQPSKLPFLKQFLNRNRFLKGFY